MSKAEELRKMLAVMRGELHDDGVIQYALQHAYNVLIKFIEYTEERLGGQEDTQSNAQNEEGGEGHQAGQAKGCDTSAQGSGKEERKAKARRPRRKRPAD